MWSRRCPRGYVLGRRSLIFKTISKTTSRSCYNVRRGNNQLVAPSSAKPLVEATTTSEEGSNKFVALPVLDNVEESSTNSQTASYRGKFIKPKNCKPNRKKLKLGNKKNKSIKKKTKTESNHSYSVSVLVLAIKNQTEPTNPN